jgi:hypothetical protein
MHTEKSWILTEIAANDYHLSMMKIMMAKRFHWLCLQLKKYSYTFPTFWRAIAWKC